MVICLERGEDLHMVQPMPLPLTVSCFTKIQIGFAFLVLAHPGGPGQRAIKRVCVCVCVCVINKLLAVRTLCKYVCACFSKNEFAHHSSIVVYYTVRIPVVCSN